MVARLCLLKFNFQHLKLQIMKNLFIVLIISLLQTVSFGQNESGTTTRSLLFLKDGSTINGVIIEELVDEYVKIRIAGGTIIEVKTQEIKRIQSNNDKYVLNADGSSSKQKGFYTGFNLQGMLGQTSGEGDQQMIFGLGAQYSLGYQINKYAAVGGGVGLQLYDRVFGDAFVQLRGFLPLGKFTPTLALDTGYGVPLVLSSVNNDWNQQKGGVSLRPSVGLRIATRRQADILLDVGYQVQHFQSESDWGWGSRTEFDVWYKRMSFRVGWLF